MTPTGSGSAGLSSTGGGGGGGGRGGGFFTNPAGGGGSGGSGIVIIRVPIVYDLATTTGSPNVVDTATYRYYTYTGNGTINFPAI
jgi:hypothetical protein